MANEKKDESAQELRAAAATLTRQLESVPTNHRAALTDTVKALTDLSGEVASGSADAKTLSKVVGEAYRADLEHRWLFVGVDEWFVYYKRPDAHFSRARKELASNPKLAAIEIRKANSYIELAAARASGLPRDSLLESVKSLDALADGIASGTIKDAAAVDDAAIASSQALGEFHYQNAVNAWEKKDQELSARSLQASIHHLKQELAGADQHLASETAAALNEAHEFVTRIEKGTKAEEAVMTKHIKAVEAALAEIKKKLEKG